VTLTISELPPPSGEWVVRYDSPAHVDDYAAALATDSAGNVYITGASIGAGTGQDILTIKYNGAGSVVWMRRYDAGHSAPSNNESPTAIAVDSSGNVLVTGIQQDGAYSNQDYITIKYSSGGGQEWAIDYDGNAIADDIPRAIAVDSTGNVYVTGESPEAPSANPDFVTIKYGPSGNQLWVSRYDGVELNLEDMAKALALDSSGNVYVAGTSHAPSTNLNYVLVKYDNFGVQQWDKVYDGPLGEDDQVSALALDSSGNIYVGGSSDVAGGYKDFCTVKWNKLGEFEWARTYNRVGYHDLLNAMAVDSSGNVYVTGRSDGGSDPDPISDYVTVKYDSAGTQQWVALYDGPDHVQDVARAIAVDPAGNIYVVGESDGTGTSFDYAAIKYDGSGNELWVRRYNGPGNFNDSAAAVVIDPAGNVLITGTSTGSGTGTDFATIKYRATLQEWVFNKDFNSLNDEGNAIALDSSGNAWVTGKMTDSVGGQVTTFQIYNNGNPGMLSAYSNGSAGPNDAGKSIAVHNATGDVYVAGTITGSSTDLDYFTQKIVPGSPGSSWVRLYNGASSNTDEANAMTIDTAGNVYVTGRSYGTDYDFATIKYSPTGTSSWTEDLSGFIDAYGAARYSGSGNSDDQATAIAVDGSGNVYVTGYTDVDTTGGFSYDYLTIKYDSTGHRLWKETFDVGTYDMAEAIAVDSSGNVYVTGGAGVVGEMSCVTVKYDSGGNFQWAKTYTGPGSGSDFGDSIAIDTTGKIYVTGVVSNGSDASADYLTIKYDQNGNELWARAYNGTGSGWDIARDLALDSSGNVVVTGESVGIPGTNMDYATVKYDANGNELWVMRYNGPGGPPYVDQALALAIDSSGNVFVTGRSFITGHNYDYATVKYRKEGT
jgi:uncharacterized delta-60 repeat protein